MLRSAYETVYGGPMKELAFTALTDTRFYGLNAGIGRLVFRGDGGGDARLQRAGRNRIAAQDDAGHCAVRGGVVRCGGRMIRRPDTAFIRYFKSLTGSEAASCFTLMTGEAA